jgi:ribosome biogenesis GTPase
VQHLPPIPAALGWDDHLAAFAADLPAALTIGRVARADRGRALVLTATGAIHPVSRVPVAVGDWVGVDAAGERIDAVLPRRTAITRRDPGQATGELVVAANIDRVLVVQAINRPANLRRLERELVLAWESGARPVVVLTKADLCPDVERAVEDVESVAIGATVVPVSSATGWGVDRLEVLLSPGTTFVVLGASGVGKSTLINRLAGAEVQRTQAIRDADGRGRHTTTAGELVVLASGAILVDTPGLKALALWEGSEGLAQVFVDIDELAPACRFADCEHDTEPGCAVRAVVGEERVASWRKLRRELARTSGDRTARDRADERRRWKAINRAQRAHRPRR